MLTRCLESREIRPKTDRPARNAYYSAPAVTATTTTTTTTTASHLHTYISNQYTYTLHGSPVAILIYSIRSRRRPQTSGLPFSRCAPASLALGAAAVRSNASMPASTPPAAPVNLLGENVYTQPPPSGSAAQSAIWLHLPTMIGTGTGMVRNANAPVN